MTRLTLSAAAMLLTAGTASAHTAQAAHTHSEMVVASAVVIGLGALAVKALKRTR